MLKKTAAFLIRHKKTVIGYGIYYAAFLIFSICAFSREWPLRIPMLILFPLLLLFSSGGGESYEGRNVIAHREPMLGEMVNSPERRDTEGFPIVHAVFLVLPPGLYLLADLFIL